MPVASELQVELLLLFGHGRVVERFDFSKLHESQEHFRALPNGRPFRSLLQLLIGCTCLRQNRAIPIVAPSVNKGIIRIPVRVSFVASQHCLCTYTAARRDLLDYLVRRFLLPHAKA